MPYKRVGRVIYTKSSGTWQKKQTAKSVSNAIKAMRLLEGLEHGMIRRPKSRRAD